MSEENRRGAPRSIQLEVEIGADARAVWSALSEPEKLANWFAPEVEVARGDTSELIFRWTDGVEHRCVIELPEPQAHLRWVGAPARGAAEGTPAGVDFHLSREGEGTLVKLASSGIPEGSTDRYEALKGGWIYYLYNLKYYLEEHPGARRRMIWDRRPAKESRESAWRRILGRLGLGVEPRPEELGPGDRFTCRLAEGVELEGSARFVNPPVHFAGSIDSIPGTLLFVELEPGSDVWHCGFWISTYDVDEGDREKLWQGLVGIADRLFGPETRGG